MPEQAPPRSFTGPRIWGLLLLATGVAVLIATNAIRSPEGWAATGPRFVALIVGILVVVLSLLFLARTTALSPDLDLAERAAREDADTDWAPPAAIVGALVAYLLLLEPLGYVVATTAFFPPVARLLGSRSPLRDVAIGLGLALILFILFTQFLGRSPGRGDAHYMTVLATIGELIDGFGTVLEPKNLLFALLGVFLGTFVGVLPGIGPALTIALLLPLTFNFEDPVGAFILFAGVYFGGMYGGSTTSILLNTPGESASVATAIEGFEMAKRGRGKSALATAAIGSFIAGTIGLLLLTFLARPVADLAVKLQPAEYFRARRARLRRGHCPHRPIADPGLALARAGAGHRARGYRPVDGSGAAHVRDRPALRRR
jgi:Tripartite tricarboxylate transporter TctA family/Tripartite tricarboxylate transporter TctB family